MGIWGKKTEANPAKIIDNFQDEDEHKKVALFNSPLINQNLTMQEKEKAVNDAVILIKRKALMRGQKCNRYF